MNRLQAQIAFLKASIVFTLVLGGILTGSIWDTRPEAGAPLVPNVVARIPASIPNILTEKKVTAPTQNFFVFKPKCLSHEVLANPLKVDSAWMRVSSELCGSNTSARFHLTNLSNNFEATIFNRSKYQFTSDFIPLSRGVNHLRMDVELDGGQLETFNWSVERPSSPN